MPGPVFYDVQILTHLSIIKTLSVDAITMHILQMRNLRQTKVMSSRTYSWLVSAGVESEFRCLAPRPVPLATMLLLLHFPKPKQQISKLESKRWNNVQHDQRKKITSL